MARPAEEDEGKVFFKELKTLSHITYHKDAVTIIIVLKHIARVQENLMIRTRARHFYSISKTDYQL